MRTESQARNKANQNNVLKHLKVSVELGNTAGSGNNIQVTAATLHMEVLSFICIKILNNAALSQLPIILLQQD